MKTVNAAVSNAIRNDYAVYAQPKLTAEWNMNRYFDTTVDNDPDEDNYGYDVEYFPISSIVKPNRPTKGILKARTDEALVTDLDDPSTSRYYTASDDDVYHYWTSPFPTDASKTFVNGTYPNGSVHPYVIYEQDVKINKIVIKVENFWATPDLFYVKTTTNGTYSYVAFNTVATSPTINNKGEIILYWNGTTWSSTKPTDLTDPPLATVRGIMIDVRTMKEGRDLNGNISTASNRTISYTTKPYTGASGENLTATAPIWGVTHSNLTGALSFFNLIEISGRREVDLSPYLISVDDEFDVTESSDLYPIGTLTTNGGTVNLSNLYTSSGVQKIGWFNSDNAESPYVGILEPNVEFNLEYIYTVGGNTYSVQEFKLYGGSWTGQKSDTVTIEMHDLSVFLEEITPPPALYENMTVPQLFQRILDSCGFVNWVLDDDDRNSTHVIPIFWMNQDKNCWEVLDELAKGTQTAIYFDSYGQLQIKTRYAAYDDTKSPVWTLRGEDFGSTPADIIELTDDGEVGTNHFTISYQTTAWDNWNNGTPSMKKVWEPDGTVTLMSSPLIRTMNSNDTIFWLPPSHVIYWPYAGMCQIEGEIINYRGKHFVYYPGGFRAEAYVGSADEYAALMETVPDTYKGYCYFTGAVQVNQPSPGDYDRGYWNSEVSAHRVDLNSYTVKRVYYNNSGQALITVGTAGLYHDSNNSIAQLRSYRSAAGLDMTLAHIGNSADTGFQYVGTKLTFQPGGGYTDQQAGIVLNSNSDQDGYYIDIRANALSTPHKGLCVYSVKNNQVYILATIPALIAEGVGYELDVALYLSGSNQILNVYLDGRRYVSIFIPSGAAYYNTKGGRLGMFTRGKSAPNYEYLYGISRAEPDPGDDATFWNLVHGGFTGAQWDREWVFGWKSRKKRKKKKWTKELYRWNQYFFDEFGPYVHELRLFDVRFDPAPAQISRLYSTNDWYSVCTEYRASPFGATFVMANTARTGAIINGDDEYTFPGRSLDQVLTVIGRVLVFADAETVVVKNDDSIRVRGKLEAELESPWIQTKQMAEDISGWMNNHWSEGLDTVTVTIFGNPLIELTDVVSVEFPARGMTAATHQYFVTAIRNSFETGIETELTLRRVNSADPGSKDGWNNHLM